MNKHEGFTNTVETVKNINDYLVKYVDNFVLKNYKCFDNNQKLKNLISKNTSLENHDDLLNLTCEEVKEKNLGSITLYDETSNEYLTMESLCPETYGANSTDCLIYNNKLVKQKVDAINLMYMKENMLMNNELDNVIDTLNEYRNSSHRVYNNNIVQNLIKK